VVSRKEIASLTGLHLPSTVNRLLEIARLREIQPSDICRRPDLLFRYYPDLAGDGTAIGPGDDGKCQSWRDYPNWWRDFLLTHGLPLGRRQR